MMMTEDLTLEDLAQSSGLSLRTLRFYIQEGLLPGPDTRGKNARYSREHRNRLDLIQRLKDLRLPLQEIKQILDSLAPEEVSRFSESRDLQQLAGGLSKKRSGKKVDQELPSSSALEYIRNLEMGRRNVQQILESKQDYDIKLFEMNQPPELDILQDLPARKSEELWTRIVLAEGVELNFKHPKRIEERQRINKLIQYAQRIFLNNDKGDKDDKTSAIK